MAEIFELTIEKLVTGGAGLGRHDGQAVFVPLTAPGDQIRARACKPGKNFLEAELLEVVAAGPGRRPAPCPHYGTCGGCDLQHLDDNAQGEARRGILLDCFGASAASTSKAASKRRLRTHRLSVTATASASRHTRPATTA